MTHMPAFHTTRWSLIAALRDPAQPTAQQAMGELCAIYWYPIYAFIRRSGHAADAAQDLTQGFVTQLLERGGLSGADQIKGRFRSYLLGAVRHYLANEHDRTTAAKRGGGQKPLSLDFPDAERRYLIEPADGRTPDQLFDRRWALAILEKSLEELRIEYESAGSVATFERLKDSLTGGGSAYTEVAVDLGMTEGAARIAAHRLRKRFRERLRRAVADTADDVDEEIRDLFRALAQ